jgi:hypothetical protein
MILNPDMNQCSDDLTCKSLQEVQLNEFPMNQIINFIVST